MPDRTKYALTCPASDKYERGFPSVQGVRSPDLQSIKQRVEMRRALVTGGAGFIGSHLAEALAGQGYGVTILDDLSTGEKANLGTVLRLPDVRFIEGSILDNALLDTACQGVDVIFHEAAIASVSRGLAEPRLSHDVNVTGTLNVLMAARENNVGKVVFASSAAVYGDSLILPNKEDQVLNPKSLYAATKLTDEHYCGVFAAAYGLRTVCLRYFNVFGPRQDPDSEYSAVIPKFINRVLHDRPPIIYGDGENTRDFVFVGDVARANILAAESDATGVYNIAAGKPVSLNRLAELIGGVVGKKVLPVHKAERPGDIKHSLADISKAGEFGYVPAFSFEAGVSATIRSFLAAGR